jgi:hypothetical protein
MTLLVVGEARFSNFCAKNNQGEGHPSGASVASHAGLYLLILFGHYGRQDQIAFLLDLHP